MQRRRQGVDFELHRFVDDYRSWLDTGSIQAITEGGFRLKLLRRSPGTLNVSQGPCQLIHEELDAV
jgi:hypothetical protein